MKALTLWQPWASLVAYGFKSIETRCWATNYRGELAIHSASQRQPKWLGDSRYKTEFRDEFADCFNCRRDRDDRTGKHVDQAMLALPRGKVLCIVRLIEIEETSELLREIVPRRELIFGNYEDGRYAWRMELLEKFAAPIPAKGNRMIWNWERPNA